jgi:uncharacterized protein YlaI
MKSTGHELSHGDSKARPIKVEQVRNWPVDYYLCDIIEEGFACCLDAAKRLKNGSLTFHKFFGIPFTSSTFYANFRIFYLADNVQLCEECIHQGRTDQWSCVSFMERAKRPRHT